MQDVKPKPHIKRVLREHNVTLLDPYKSLYECNNCHERWMTNTLTGGKNQRRYWARPRGCNTDQALPGQTMHSKVKVKAK